MSPPWEVHTTNLVQGWSYLPEICKSVAKQRRTDHGASYSMDTGVYFRGGGEEAETWRQPVTSI